MVSKTIIIEGAQVILPNRILRKGYVVWRDNVIIDVGEGVCPTTHSVFHDLTRIDAEGWYVAPGFVDVHVHGGQGGDAMDGTYDSLYAMCQLHALHGTTGMLPTTITVEEEPLCDVLADCARVIQSGKLPIRTYGIHVEGPFINPLRRGAHRPEPMRPLTLSELGKLRKASGDHVRWLTIAPEILADPSVIAAARQANILCSIGHSDATYEQAQASFTWGIAHGTHFGNAMRPFHHRDPGVLGAILANRHVTTEIIADGIHVHPGAIEVLLQAKGPENVLLITDAVRAAGMPDGDYELGGSRISLKKGVVSLPDGTLAGSSLTMDCAVRFMVETIGLPIPTAICMASLTPAKRLGLDGVIGSLAPGKEANILLLDESFAPTDVWVGGEAIVQNRTWIHSGNIG